MNHRVLTFLLVGSLWASLLPAETTLPGIFSDGVVLQRGLPILIWGNAPKGEKVTVSFRDASGSTEADQDNKWRIELPAQMPGGPFTLFIQGSNKIELKDVYVGDVWLASGQSNANIRTEKPIPETERQETIRQFTGYMKGYNNDIYPLCTWTTGLTWYQLAWVFARDIAEKEKVPIGILCCAQGGSGINQFMVQPHNKVYPSCYERLIEPLLPFRIKGVIWWQGENNTWERCPTMDEPNIRYHKEMIVVVEGWRKIWNQGEFPFLYVQLQRSNSPDLPNNLFSWPTIRDGQRLALSIPNTAMVVSFDVTTGNLHPPFPEKTIIAKRMAVAAEALAYGKMNLEWSGPVFESAKKEGDNVVIRFTHAGKNLVAREGDLKEFEIRSGDGKWTETKAIITANTVVIPSAGLAPPLRVRYACKSYPRGNLYNSDELPASPFITDEIR